MRMKAAVMNEVRQPLVVEEVELDPPKAGEVLVKMHATGVCHSDLHYYTGDIPREMPLLLGHEGAGVVQEVGEGVTGVNVGDHVVMSFLPSCGRCKYCQSGHPVLCELSANLRSGGLLDGTRRLHRTDGSDINHFLFVSTFAEYSVVPEASVIPVPADAPLEKLCLLGCGFTTGFGSATNGLPIKPGESVVVIGCGGVGLSAIQGAALSGAGSVIAVDVHEQKLQMARKFGATHTVLSRGNTKEVLKEIQGITNGEGADYSIESVGGGHAAETADLGFRAIHKGGTMVFAGLASKDVSTLNVDPKALMLMQKTVKGMIFGDSQFKKDIPRYAELYRQGKINLDDLISREVRLEDINGAFEEVLSGDKVARQVIRFD